MDLQFVAMALNESHQKCRLLGNHVVRYSDKTFKESGGVEVGSIGHRCPAEDFSLAKMGDD